MDSEERITLAREAPFRVGRVVVDPPARTIIGADGQSERLEPRVMQVLVQLARAGGHVVSRDDLTECCWDGRIVGDDAINRVISRLRKASTERDGGFGIETIPRVGYRLVGKIAPVVAPEPAGSEQPAALTLIRGFDTRRRRFWAMLAGVGALATVAMTGLAAEAVRARAAARAGRADAEQLVEFMLGDLRKRLDAVGRLDVLDSVGAETMRYYNRQPLDSLNADELARRARALQMVGELRSTRGEFAPAAAAFGEAANTTRELMARDPGNGQRVFDHAQSVFALASLAMRGGNREDAAKSFGEYARLTEKLVALNPARDDWRAEYAYGRSNLGMVEYGVGSFDPAILNLKRAAGILKSIYDRHPTDGDYAAGFLQTEAWLADVLRTRGEFAQALNVRAEQAAIYRRQLAHDPANMQALLDLAWCEHERGSIALDMGDVPGAVTRLQVARALIEQQARTEPSNVLMSERAVPVFYDLATAQSLSGDQTAAALSIAEARRHATRLVARDSSVAEWRDLRARADVVRAELAFRSGNPVMAKWLASDASEILNREGAHGNFLIDIPRWRVRAHLVVARADPSGAAAQWQAILAEVRPQSISGQFWAVCAANSAKRGLDMAAANASTNATQRCGTTL